VCGVRGTVASSAPRTSCRPGDELLARGWRFAQTTWKSAALVVAGAPVGHSAGVNLASRSISARRSATHPRRDPPSQFGRVCELSVPERRTDRRKRPVNNEGQKVSFDIVADRKTGKSAAENLRAA
jgi:hypothetical protein